MMEQQQEYIPVYQEEWEYSWVKSSAKPIGQIEAVSSFKHLWSADFYPRNHYVYVIDEQQLYRAKHKKRLVRLQNSSPVTIGA